MSSLACSFYSKNISTYSLAFIFFLFLSATNEASGTEEKVNFQLLSCNLINKEKDEYPYRISIKILSNLLKTHQIIDGIAQLSVDVRLKTKSGVDYKIIDSQDFRLNAINFNTISITYKNKENLRLDRRSLDINVMESRTTQTGTTFDASFSLYKCDIADVETKI